MVRDQQARPGRRRGPASGPSRAPLFCRPRTRARARPQHKGARAVAHLSVRLEHAYKFVSQHKRSRGLIVNDGHARHGGEAEYRGGGRRVGGVGV
eukprot:scaffold33624_cov45-Isochrysis_galbana.AAC.1